MNATVTRNNRGVIGAFGRGLSSTYLELSPPYPFSPLAAVNTDKLGSGMGKKGKTTCLLYCASNNCDRYLPVLLVP